MTVTALDDPGRLLALRRLSLPGTGQEEVFDRAARLATRVLDAKVSLLSIVDHEKQVFRGKAGPLTPDETPLSHSFCKHVVETGEPLEVTDAREDSRVAKNLAIRDLGVIGYLGVPVRDPDGHVLGSFCAITPEPREWTEADRLNIADIARGVESELAARAAAERERAQRETFHTILDQMPVGVAVAEVPSGAIAFVNARGSDLAQETNWAGSAEDYARFGAEHDDGRRYRPEDYPLVRSVVGRESITKEMMHYKRGDGQMREFEVSSNRIPTQPPLAVAIFTDVTDEQRLAKELATRDRRMQIFHNLSGDGLLEVDAENRIVWANYRMRRWIDEEVVGDTELTLEGRPVTEVLGRFTGQQMRQMIRDARADHALQTADFTMPVSKRVAEMRMSADEDGALMIYVHDVTEARRLAEARDMLTRELNHRVKNLFAIVSGMVGMTARVSETPKEMARSLRDRIQALARAHDLIRPAFAAEDVGDYTNIAIAALASSIISPHLHHRSDRVCFEGEAVMLSPSGSTNLALVFHELATNAAKYGALSGPSGSLRVNWAAEGSDLVIDWEETGGPEVTPPTDAGFGSTLLGMIAEGQLRGKFERRWEPDGLKVRLRLPLAMVEGLQAV